MVDQAMLGSDGVWNAIGALDETRLAYFSDTGRYHSIRGTAVLERARRYIARIPGAVQGQRGSDATFAVACALVHGFELEPADAISLLTEWNATCDPPWSTGEIMHKIYSANRKRQSRPSGYLLRRAKSTTP